MQALILYYEQESPDTPARIKLAIYGALVYFIVPTDMVPDPTPVVGYTDDLGALAAVIMMANAYITPEIEERAEDKLKEFGFGE